MKRTLGDKVAAFCRELGDSTLRDMARSGGMEPEFLRAEKAVIAGQIDPVVEADLDALDEMVRGISKGLGLYSGSGRDFKPLPGIHGAAGAQWWTCPAGRCSGWGRVRPGDKAPVCSVTGEHLVPGPMPE